MEELQRVYADIDLDAIEQNIRIMEGSLGGSTPIMAVIKTNAYGHGAVAIARFLEPMAVIHGFAVATAEEALQLRKAGIRKMILILGYVFPKDYPELIRERVRLCVFRYDMAEEISRAAAEVGQTAYIHIKVDTGMSRIGFPGNETSAGEIEKIAALPAVETEGIFTHFARADEADKQAAHKQFALFSDFVRELENRGLCFSLRHCCNSASILELPDYSMDMVRAGITLYGLWPSDEVKRDVALQPVMSLYSHIVHLKTLPPDTPISYGGTYVTTKEQRIATIPIGYGDGYPRSLSNRGYVLVHGRSAPIVGRVCMDQMMVDVTDIADVSLYDRVTLIGADGKQRITMEDLGNLSGRFNYELACDFGIRIPRRYYKNGKKIDELNFFA